MELSSQEGGVLEHLELLLRKGDDVATAAGRLKTMINDDVLVDKVVAVHREIAESKLHIAVDEAVADPEDFVPWYTGPSPDDRFWPALEEKLLADAAWAEAVQSLDDTSTNVVGLLDDPHSPSIDTRGLVLGYVQSGKTANFTATIAKAGDAGYRLFIVLSGVHNALRRQTQLRLDEQLYELNKTRWLQLTDETSDFGNPVKALALLAGTDLRLLAVVKKNVSRLTRLRDWLAIADRERGLDTCPVLIIDDECDQASPNAARDPELDRTRINQLIVDLLKFPRVAYLGYTATPFANVLINPNDVQDMYPRDFVYALPKPPSYFGSEELFGKPVTEEEQEEDPDNAPHNMIRLVPADEVASYVSASPPEVTPALGKAIRWFVLATAARRTRSGEPNHSSMLIHTTQRIAPQLALLPVIREFVKNLRESWANGEEASWSEQWNQEQNLEPSGRSGLEPVSFSDLRSAIPDVLADVKAVADNSGSLERLIYTDDPATVIAVGGNTLSRGLTLEGLVSSFFLRSAKTYDALLQMGRWFGYRPGYGDLPRIWTTADLMADFRFLSEIEAELRVEMERIRMEGATPMQLPIRIRLHPTMQITAKQKMFFAVPGEASYSGQRPQTTYFHYLDQSEISMNHVAARDLIAAGLSVSDLDDRDPSRLVIRNVPAEFVLKFINEFQFHPDTELRSNLLTKYIVDQQKFDWLTGWSIAVITRRPPAQTFELGLSEPVNLITRSRLIRSSGNGTANIGTLMSKPDRVADLMGSAKATASSESELLAERTLSRSGLVLLYPIDKDSAPKKGTAEYREPLGAVDHLIGTAFSFPQAAPGSMPTDTVQVVPVLIEPEDTDETYVDDEGSRDEVDLSIA